VVDSDLLTPAGDAAAFFFSLNLTYPPRLRPLHLPRPAPSPHPTTTPTAYPAPPTYRPDPTLAL